MKHRNRLALVLMLPAIVLAATHTNAQSTYTPYTFMTLAGSTGYGSADGTGSAARFAHPAGLAADGAGNVYVADTMNNTVRKVTPAGVVTTLAGLAGSFGSADGTGSAARFDDPEDVAVDRAGNLYVADSGNNTIRKLTPAGSDWVVTTLAGLAGVSGGADGTNGAAQFNSPYGVAVDSAGNVYVADFGNNTIRKLTPLGTDWVVTTLAGETGSSGGGGGTNGAAQFNEPASVAVDIAGNVYVADFGDDIIRKVMPSGVVTTVAGVEGVSGSADGIGSAARFNGPRGVAVDAAGKVYVADEGNDTLRQVTPVGTNWVVSTLAGLAGSWGGADGTNSAAQFDLPHGVAVDGAGNLSVADEYNGTIRRMTPLGTNWVVSTLAGLAAGGPGSADGTGGAASFNAPVGVAVDSAANVYVGDCDNNTVRKVTPAGVVTTLAGLAGMSGSADGTGSAARFDSPNGVAVDDAGNLFVSDSANSTIREVTPAGVVTTLAGVAGISGTADGTNSGAQFSWPNGVAADNAGNLYVADTANDTVRKVTPFGTNWVVTTLAGQGGVSGSADGTNSDARFYYPAGLAVDGAGTLYVADFGNDTIRKVTPIGSNWVVTTLAGAAGISGSADGTNGAAQFSGPNDVAVDSAGNLFVADQSNNTIRRVTPAGVVTTVAGLAGSWGSADGTGSAAQFNSPSGVAVDAAGGVYVTDADNNTVRNGIPSSAVPAPILRRPGLGAGQFGFGITGLPGLAVNIESSGDLAQWQVVGTFVLAGGTNYYSASPSPAPDARFYRGQVR